MANKRIIDLTAAGSLALTDVLEIDTGTLSLKVTGQQIYNLIAAQLNLANPLVLGGGNISIANNGTTTWSGNGLAIDNTGKIYDVPDGNLVVIDVVNQQLLDGAGGVTIAWESRLIFDTTGASLFDWDFVGQSAFYLNTQFCASGSAGTNAGVMIFPNGDVEIFDQNRGVILHSRPSGNRRRLVVNDAGVLSTEAA